MNIFICVDDDMGISFNHRRQSRDQIVSQKIAEICGTTPLYLEPDSVNLFDGISISLSPKSPCIPGKRGAFCFPEKAPLAPYADQIETLYLFHWNRKYPSDQKLDLDLTHGWHLVSVSEFAGSSHPNIKLEVYCHDSKND